MSDRDDIKQRIDIVDLIGKHLTLKRGGKNYMGLCPFHNEKSPSFTVSKQRQTFYCFGCHKHGDIFDFIQEIEHITFREALERLAPIAGVQLQAASPEAAKKQERRERLIGAATAAAAHFRRQLAARGDALAYARSRGLSDETMERFSIGYAADSFTAMTDELKKQGYTDDELHGAGLATSKDGRATSLYDRFRHRLMFPIHSPQGKIVAFTGRVLRAEDTPKYLNSPETDIFHKHQVLYGLHQAREHIIRQQYVIVVEGQMDCVALHQAGFCNTVAISGTALSPEQIGLLRRICNVIVFALDTDKAGQAALLRSAELALAEGMEAMGIDLPDGKDPDSYIQAHGAEAFAAVLEARKEIVPLLLGRLAPTGSAPTLQGRQAAAAVLLPLLRAIPSAIARQHWAQEVAGALHTTLAAVLEDMRRLPAPEHSTASGAIAPAAANATPQKQTATAKPGRNDAELLLGLLVLSGGKTDNMPANLLDDCGNEQAKALYTYLWNVYHKTADAANYTSETKQQLKEYAVVLSFHADKAYPSLTHALPEAQRLATTMQRRQTSQRISLLKQQLGSSVDAAEQEAILLEINRLNKELKT